MLNLTFLGGKKPSQCSGKRSNKGEMDEATSTNNKANESNTSRSYYGTTNSECQNMVNRALQKNSFVKYVINAMETAGCSIPKNFFRVEDCEMAVGGGFMPEEGVVVCSNHVMYQEEVDTILIHELIHAYDHCRAANLDWGDCKHHACSEIRAASLSGACQMNKEILTSGSNFVFRAGYQACVRRKAELSVAMNPNCKPEEVKPAVEAAWNCCYKDTTPFDRIP